MSSALFFRNGDNVADAGTFTASVAPDATYENAWIYDEISARPVIWGASGVNLLWDFSSAQRIDAVVIPVHNLDTTATLILRQHASDLGAGAWSAASMSKTVTIPADTGDGHSTPILVDLTPVSGYTASGRRFFRIEISGNTGPGYVAIGEILLYTTKRTFSGIQGGYTWVEGHRTKIDETDYGVKIRYPRGVRMKRLECSARLTTAFAAELLTIHQQARGPNRPVTIVLDDAGTFIKQVPITGMFLEEELKFTSISDGGGVVEGSWDTSFTIMEDSRGLPL